MRTMQLTDLIRPVHNKTFEKGTHVFVQDEAPTCAYVVKEGVIKVYDISAGGEERLISFKTAGTIFSLGWLFSRHSKALYYYEAYTDCTLGIVDKSEFITKVTHDNEFSLSLMNFLITEHIGDGIRFNALEQPSSR